MLASIICNISIIALQKRLIYITSKIQSKLLFVMLKAVISPVKLSIYFGKLLLLTFDLFLIFS